MLKNAILNAKVCEDVAKILLRPGDMYTHFANLSRREKEQRQRAENLDLVQVEWPHRVPRERGKNALADDAPARREPTNS